MSPARLGEAQLEKDPGRPGAEVPGHVPHALANGVQGKTAVHTSLHHSGDLVNSFQYDHNAASCLDVWQTGPRISMLKK